MKNKYTSYGLYSIGHWYNLHDVETKYGYQYLRKNNIKLINLIRHPIDRTHSNWHNLLLSFSQGMLEEHKAGFRGSIENQKDWLDDFLKEHPISLQKAEEAAFIGACLNLFACSLDASYEKYHHIQIESLNNQVLIKLLEEMSDGKIIVQEKDIENIKPIKNSHYAHFYQKSQNTQHEYKESMTTEEKYLSWLPWQQQLYKLCVQKSKLNKYYKKYQYDLLL